jgi:hypothetical protein
VLADPSTRINAVHRDADYQDLWRLREQLVHRYRRRHIALGLPGGDARISLYD